MSGGRRDAPAHSLYRRVAHLARVGVTETNLANALGLCGYHHHLAHHPAWKLVHTDDEWTLKRISPSD